jgi:hypothetical protein
MANRSPERRWSVTDERVAELREHVDKILSTMNVHECRVIRDMLNEDLVTFEEVPPLVANARVYRQFHLLTNGSDQELDAIGVIVDAMASLQGYEIERILTYLLARYTRRG